TYDIADYAFDEYGEPIPVEEVRLDRVRIRVGASLDPNDWGSVLATTAPLALWLSFGSLRRRIFWLPATAVITLAVVPTASRGSLLGLVAAAMVLVFLGSKGWGRAITAGFVGVAALGFMLVVSEGQITRFLDFSPDD